MLAEEAAAAATEVPETEVESEAPAAAEEAEAKPAKAKKGARGEEARHGEEAGRPPAVRRDDLGGNHGAQGEDRVELGGHQQVRGGEARHEAAAQLPQAAGRAAQEARGRGEADPREELVQPGRRRMGAGRG
ncbi:hypothetical protein PVAP13_8NG132801 [Panicum virgatum]|uniref:Uncharacterized protein n=1 Tax=Panicum virgatum TaxID=38727 RepID=A0A8T0PAW6_PANVG|nr:hypothetical protein PVAP13_8NG132801 [Panicum virgatum]